MMAGMGSWIPTAGMSARTLRDYGPATTYSMNTDAGISASCVAPQGGATIMQAPIRVLDSSIGWGG